jgi:hypothetical protein
MAALTDLSDLINRQTGGNNGAPDNVFFHKVPRIAGVAAPALISGRAASLWTFDGMPGGAGAPGAASIPTRTSAGAIPFTAPATGRDKLQLSIGIASQVAGLFLLYDRLFHMSGLSGVLTTDQTVQGTGPTPALTRNSSGAGNFAFFEIYTQLGTTSTTLTMTYTDQDGNTGQTATINCGGTGFRELTRAQRIPLAAGNSGLRAVEKIRLSASTTTAGDFGITIAQPLAWVPVGAAGAGGWRDYTTGLPGIPSPDPNACLALLFIPTSTTAPELFGMTSFVEK